LSYGRNWRFAASNKSFSKAPVSIDAILEALGELDGGPRNPSAARRNAASPRRESLGGMKKGSSHEYPGT